MNIPYRHGDRLPRARRRGHPRKQQGQALIGLLYYMLAREARPRGSISRNSRCNAEGKLLADLFFYHDPEEIEFLGGRKANEYQAEAQWADEEVVDEQWNEGNRCRRPSGGLSPRRRTQAAATA